MVGSIAFPNYPIRFDRMQPPILKNRQVESQIAHQPVIATLIWFG